MPTRSILVLILVAALAAPVGADPRIEALRGEKSPTRARRLVDELASLESDEAWQALIDHLAEQGPAQEAALEALWTEDVTAAHHTILNRAARARVADPVSLLAVRASALIPGERAVRVLERLAADWSEEVREAAERALKLRRLGGFSSETAIKEVPVNTTLGTPVGSGPTGGTDPLASYRVIRGDSRRSQSVRRRRRRQRLEQARLQQAGVLGRSGGEKGGGVGSQPRPRLTGYDPPPPAQQGQSTVTANSQEDPPEN